MSTTYDQSSAVGPGRQIVTPGVAAWDRAGPVLGIVSWLFVFGGFAIHLYPNGSSPHTVLAFVANTDSNRFMNGLYVENLGYPLLLVYLAWLGQRLFQAGGSAWLLALGVGAITVWFGSAMIVQGTWAALVQSGKAGVDDKALIAIFQIATNAYNDINLALGLGLAAIGLGALAGPDVPRWIGWTVLAIGLAAIAGAYIASLGNLATLLFTLWSIALAIRCLVRPSLTIVRVARSV